MWNQFRVDRNLQYNTNLSLISPNLLALISSFLIIKWAILTILGMIGQISPNKKELWPTSPKISIEHPIVVI